MPNTILAESGTEKLSAVRALIEREADVRSVIKLEALPDGRFRYLIETPFATFPKFVLGTTDEANDDVRIRLKCGAIWNAERHWRLWTLRLRAQAWREGRASIAPGGYVIVANDIACGWKLRLDVPVDWIPGAFAIPEDEGEIHVATGGNAQSGAVRWALESDSAESHRPPLVPDAAASEAAQ